MEEKSMDEVLLVVVSALVSGLIATFITLWWQKRTEAYNRKMKVFETLMIYRIPGVLHFKENVHTLNSIDVVFYDDENVRRAYKDFLNETDKPKEMNPNIQDKHLKLLEEMAKSLGLKKLCWEDIKHPYFPIGYSDLLKDEEAIRKTSIMSNLESAKFTHELNNRQIVKDGEDRK
jgi:hypothetical protein